MVYTIFNSDANDNTFKTFAKKFKELYPDAEYRIQKYNTGSKTALIMVPNDKTVEVSKELPTKIQEVDFYSTTVAVMTGYAPTTHNDPDFGDARNSWHFEPIQAYEAWDITMGSPDVIVGIVDSYMDLSHPELAGDRYILPHSIPKNTSDIYPDAGVREAEAGHGTLVTSVAVGNIDNNSGTSGIAPRCKYIPVSLGEHFNTVTIIEGLLYCLYHDADVINLSVGSVFSPMSLDEQLDFAKNYGVEQEKVWDYVFKLAEERKCTIVWAAGNENVFCAMDASKRNPGTIRVSALDTNLKKADFSNFGNFSDKGIHESNISAPGVKIWGALPNNNYGAWDGTSFSAPIITGVVALMKSINKDLTSEQIIEILESTGKPVSGTTTIGNIVQIKDALLKVQETLPTTTTSATSM